MKIIEKFTDLDKANSYVTDLNKAFGESVDQAKAIGEQHKALEKDLVQSKKDHEKALAEVADLSGRLDLQEKHGADGGTIVKIGKVAYKLSGNRFITKDGEKNAEEVSKDAKFLANLLEIGSGALTPIV